MGSGAGIPPESDPVAECLVGGTIKFSSSLVWSLRPDTFVLWKDGASSWMNPAALTIPTS